MEGEQEFVVEQILDSRLIKKGCGSFLEYLVKWEGYPLHDATWEPEKHLVHARDKISEYLSQ